MGTQIPRELIGSEIDEILDFIPSPNKTLDSLVRDVVVMQYLNNFEDELSTIKLKVGKHGAMKDHLIHALPDASSIVGESMIRSAQSLAKGLVQDSLSTKRGNNSKQDHISSVAVIKEVIRFSEKRSINHVYLWLAPRYDNDGNVIPATKNQVARAAVDIYCVTLHNLIISVKESTKDDERAWDPEESRPPFIRIHLNVPRMIHFRITPGDIVRALETIYRPDKNEVEVYASPMSDGVIDLFFLKSDFKMHANTNVLKMASKSLVVSGINGVVDVSVEKADIYLSLRDCYRSWQVEGYNWRVPLARAYLHAATLRIEDAEDVMSALFPDSYYDYEEDYFYINSDINPGTILAEQHQSNPELFNRYYIKAETSKPIVQNLLMDHRFDARRTMSNDLVGGYEMYGVEFAVAWCNHELYQLTNGSKKTDFHTLQPIIDRNFALGYATPVTTKGHKAREISVLASMSLGKGEDTIRKAAISQDINTNNDVSSCHKVGTPAPFGSNNRVGLKYPNVSVCREISQKYKVTPYRGSVTTRFVAPEPEFNVRDYTEDAPDEMEKADVENKVEEYIPVDFGALEMPA